MRESLEKRLRCSPVAKDDRLLRHEPVEDGRVGRVALDPAVAKDERVDGRGVPSTSFAAASLCGAVTFAPAKPAATSPRRASSRRSGGTSSAT